MNNSGTTNSRANKAKKEVANAYSSVKKSVSNLGVSNFIGVIILLIIVIIIIIMWGKAVSNVNINNNIYNPILVSEPVNAANTKLAYKTFTIPPPTQGLGFAYSMWIYIEDFSYRLGLWKNIITNGNESSGFSPLIRLYPNTNTLHARISTSVSLNEGCDVPDIPLQKWVHIVYILNNRNVSIYVNNKLARSCALKGIPIINPVKNKVSICHEGGFYGKISRVHYFSKTISQTKILQLYNRGPFNEAHKYNLQLFNETPFDVVNSGND